MELAKTTRFGSDLRLLQNLDRQNSRVRGDDLRARQSLRSGRYDLETLERADNLRQALLLRFMTPVGELGPLGHPTYGSRLVELIGELNTERTRNRAKMYALQAVGAEPRVKQVLDARVDPNPSDRSRIDVSLSLLTIDEDTPLNLVFPFFLQGGAPS